ncbi:MAG: alpha/beta hydrolase [Bacteroidales bacterium]|nr:alpha/beta hydrolase [Bacteroidales bacterium]
MSCKSKHILWIFLLTLFTACNKVNFSHFNEGDLYVTKYESKERVLTIDNVDKKTITGRLYTCNSLMAVPQSYTVIKKGSKVVFSTGDSKHKINITLKRENDDIHCTLKDQNKTLIFYPALPEDTISYRKQYLKPIFSVKDTNIMYASADGYWTSYPDEDKKFKEIYIKRLPQLASMSEQKMHLDLYEPKNNNTKRPLIILIHGGAFYNGDKKDETYIKWSQHFASMGYVAASVNYRMGFLIQRESIDKAGYRAVQDVNAAIRYLVHHAKEYRIDPDRIFTWGTSAGGITALNVAFMRDDNRPQSVKEEGVIAKLIPECRDNFRIRAVANMWGAIHDTAILANSNTAVISFHGDADPIVPYGYGIPFKKMFDNKELLNIDFSGLIPETSESPDFLDKSIKNLKEGFNIITKKTKDGISKYIIQPIWDNLVSPMYGSSCIHQYLDNHGIRNKLFTVPKAGHSLHVDKHRKIVPYFYTIQDSVAEFFYHELYEHPVVLQQDSKDPTLFTIDDSDVDEAHWHVEGGIILESSSDKTRVLLFADQKKKSVRVSGKYNDGSEFSKTLKF